MAQRSAMSIGDVLSLLKEEFSDITVSKIRFLESQGLIAPERTTSGYRKFHEEDVNRLRWILKQQRENFLPLKVIRDRLKDGSWSSDNSEVTSSVQNGNGRGRSGTSKAKSKSTGVTDLGVSGVSMTKDELTGATGLTSGQLDELERYDLINSHQIGGSSFYDEGALVVAKLFSKFQEFGVEARHLRVYKSSADREAGLFEQLVTPLLKQRNPESKAKALDALGELTALGQDLRVELLRKAFQQLTRA